MREACELETHRQRCRKRREHEPYARLRRRDERNAGEERHEATGKRGDIQPRASRADRELTPAEMKRSLRPLMTNEPAGRVNQRGGRGHNRHARHDRHRRDREGSHPEREGGEEDAGEGQRCSPPVECSGAALASPPSAVYPRRVRGFSSGRDGTCTTIRRKRPSERPFAGT